MVSNNIEKKFMFPQYIMAGQEFKSETNSMVIAYKCIIGYPIDDPRICTRYIRPHNTVVSLTSMDIDKKKYNKYV